MISLEKENNGNNETRERIVNASIQLFSEKGFDATRVNEIARAANVNKALIYYYFKNKEDILDYLVHSLFDSVTTITMNFIQVSIIKMIKEGHLDIEPDRLRFANEEARECFLQNVHIYYERLLDYALENKAIIRILMLESLKNGKHQNALFRLVDLTKSSNDNSIFRTISDADSDFSYSHDMILFQVFFSLFPLVCFAAYYDDIKEISLLNDQELRSAFLRSFEILVASLVSNKEILLRSPTTGV